MEAAFVPPEADGGGSVKGLVSAWMDWKKEKSEREFRMFGESVSMAKSAIAAYVSVLEVAQSKEKAYVDAKRQQKDALNELTKAQLELNKAKELEGVEDEATRKRIEEKYAALASGQTYDEGRLGYAREVEDEDLAIRQMTEQLATLKEEENLSRESFNHSMKMQRASVKEGTGVGSYLFAKFGWGQNARDRANEWGESALSYQSEMNEKLKEINRLEEKIEEAKMRRKTLTDKVAAGEKSPEEARLEAEKAKRESEARDRKAQEDRRVASLKRERARERELYEYERDLAERQHARRVAEPYQDLVTQLKTAEAEMRRFRAEEEKALAKREAVMRSFAASGRADMTEEERFAFNNATSDLARSRSARYGEQSTIAELKKQMRDRRFEEGLAQRARDREDADFAREGRYSRGSWATRLRMDIERYREGRRTFEDAQRRILADNAGTAPLTPEERRIAERDRDEGRQKMTETRSALRSAAMEGDAQGTSFVASLFGHRNRLTAMGLGGDVANWDRQTASNTRKLVEQNRELLNAVNKRTGANIAWGM